MQCCMDTASWSYFSQLAAFLGERIIWRQLTVGFVSLVKGSIAQGAAILELWGWAVVARMLDALMSAESLHPPRMDSFCVVMCVLTVLAITSARRSTSGSISQLSRPTLTTLRGAMQLYLLAYHRCGLIFHGVLPFAIARVCVAAYYFLSSYGRAYSIMSAESADLISPPSSPSNSKTRGSTGAAL